MTNKFGALCLIAGTAVGSGMLALPLCTYHLGFGILLVCYFLYG